MRDELTSPSLTPSLPPRPLTDMGRAVIALRHTMRNVGIVEEDQLTAVTSAVMELFDADVELARLARKYRDARQRGSIRGAVMALEMMVNFEEPL